MSAPCRVTQELDAYQADLRDVTDAEIAERAHEIANDILNGRERISSAISDAIAYARNDKDMVRLIDLAANYEDKVQRENYRDDLTRVRFANRMVDAAISDPIEFARLVRIEIDRVAQSDAEVELCA